MTDDAAQRCRAGLGAAARALYGADAAATADALRQRGERELAPWPWLPGLCYGALEPLGVAFSREERAMVVAGKAVVGRPVRPERVTDAARALRRPEPVAPSQAPDPALAAALDRFWARLTGLTQRLGQAVRADDDDAVDRLLQRARPALRDSAAEVLEAAERVAADKRSRARPGRPPSEPEAASPSPPSEPASPPEPVPKPQRRPAADASAGPVEPPPAAEEDPSGLGPERPYAPVIFVGAALVIALILLLVVAVTGGG